MVIGFFIVTFFLKGEKKPTRNQPKREKGKKGFEYLTASILILLLMLFLQRIIRTLFTPFIPLYVQELTQKVEGVASLTGSINGLIGLITAVSAIFISRLGDIYDKMLLIRMMLILSIGDVLLLCLTDGLMPFIIFYTALFLLIGGVEPLITSTTAEMTPPNKRGSLFGIQGLVGSLGWMISPTIGAYVSVVWGIKLLFWVILAFLVMNTLVGFVVKKRNEAIENAQS